MSIPIIKSTGEEQSFSKKKLCASLEHAGAPKKLADTICKRVEEHINPGASTSKIYREALRYLVKENRELAARYSIRRGVAALGPAGFVFEQYVETILQAYGFTTKRNVMMKGECVTHEVDVMAMKDGVHYFLEMKYHNQVGIRTHINTVMYAYARLLDISAGLAKKEKDTHEHKMWLITNTKFTDTSIKYANCKGVILTGWDYPEGNSLEDMIEYKKLYPVTVLPSISGAMLEELAKKNIILAQDLLPYTPHALSKLLMIDEYRAQKIARDVAMLMK